MRPFRRPPNEKSSSIFQASAGDPEAGTKRCTSLRDRHLSNAKGQKSKSLILLACKSLILLARGGSG
jgi:hypothetical protein